MTDRGDPLLSLDGLSVVAGGRTLVRDMSFDAFRNQVLGIAGESGAGKSVTCRSLSGVNPRNIAVRSGNLRFDGRSVSRTSQGWPSLRGEIATVFQEPRLALNPALTIGGQFDVLLKAMGVRPRALRTREVVEYLARVGLDEPDRVASSFSWQLSGGMCQRVTVAMVLARRPKLVVADEPTSSLDAHVRRRLMRLLLATVQELSAGLVLVTHDLPLLLRTCDLVCVMREGEVVERGLPAQLGSNPQHPYTQALVARLDATQRTIAAGTAEQAAHS